MSSIKIFECKEFGKIRTLEINGKFYSVGVDVARALEYVNPSKAVSDHCKGDFLTWEVKDATGKMQETRLIPEGDIYRLTIKASEQSRNKSIKEKASKFEQWIFDEVLPSLRKTGRYTMPFDTALTEHPGEVANLIKVISNVMLKQGSAPYKVAENTQLICQQYGIQVITDFIKDPACEQLQLASFMTGVQA